MTRARAVPTASGDPTMGVEAFLKRVPFFADLTPAQLAQLTQAGRSSALASGQIVFREGDPGDALYVVLSGHAAVNRTDTGGQTVELAKLAPGDFFGELALIDGAPRSA